MSYAEFRAKARKSLSGKWISMSFIHFIYVMLNGIISSMALIGGLLLGLGILHKIDKVSWFENWAIDIDKPTELILKEAYGNDYEEVVYRFIQTTAKSMSDLILVLIVIIVIAVILWAIVGSMITAGLYKQYYNLAVGEEISVSGLFKSIRLWPKMLGIMFVQYAIVYIIIGIWFVTIVVGKMLALGLLPMVGILLCYIIYKFTMAPYLIVDEEDIGLREAISKSMYIIKGHIIELLGLNISFIGWAFVASFVGGIAQNILPLASTIANSVLSVYIAITVTHYYLYLTGQDSFVNNTLDTTFSNFGMDLQNYNNIDVKEPEFDLPPHDIVVKEPEFDLPPHNIYGKEPELNLEPSNVSEVESELDLKSEDIGALELNFDLSLDDEDK